MMTVVVDGGGGSKKVERERERRWDEGEAKGESCPAWTCALLHGRPGDSLSARWDARTEEEASKDRQEFSWKPTLPLSYARDRARARVLSRSFLSFHSPPYTVFLFFSFPLTHRLQLPSWCTKKIEWVIRIFDTRGDTLTFYQTFSVHRETVRTVFQIAARMLTAAGPGYIISWRRQIPSQNLDECDRYHYLCSFMHRNSKLQMRFFAQVHHWTPSWKQCQDIKCKADAFDSDNVCSRVQLPLSNAWNRSWTIRNFIRKYLLLCLTVTSDVSCLTLRGSTAKSPSVMDRCVSE